MTWATQRDLPGRIAPGRSSPVPPALRPSSRSGRWNYYRQQVENGEWDERRQLMNNWLRRFKTMCKQAKAGKLSIHDLRRSCITNLGPQWALDSRGAEGRRPRGHQDDAEVLPLGSGRGHEEGAEAPAGVGGLKVTDPKLTHRTCKRSFPGRTTFGGVAQLSAEREVA